MFGYIRPLMNKLSDSDRRYFQAVYCGLCYSLRKDYGLLGSLILNYDFAFLALVLKGAQGEECISCRSCANPFKKKKPCASNSPAMECAAAASLILFKWKLIDEVRDQGFFTRLGARAIGLIYSSSFKRAAARLPDFEAAVAEGMDRLSALEQESCRSPDMAAHAFAQMLASIASQGKTERERRCLRELFYHTGRWIYLVDACDDLKGDLKKGAYNPIALRFEIQGDRLSDRDRQYVEGTLLASANRAMDALELMEQGPGREICENVLLMGMPAVSGLVLEGEWRKVKAQNKRKKEWT